MNNPPVFLDLVSDTNTLVFPGADKNTINRQKIPRKEGCEILLADYLLQRKPGLSILAVRQGGLRVTGMEVCDNVLRVSVDLDLSNVGEFKDACQKLIAVEDDTLYLDISQAGFIGSSMFGQMFVLNALASDGGRSLVIRTSRQLLSIMELLGLPDLVTIEVVEKD